jgi:hypothetical protein
MQFHVVLQAPLSFRQPTPLALCATCWMRSIHWSFGVTSIRSSIVGASTHLKDNSDEQIAGIYADDPLIRRSWTAAH